MTRFPVYEADTYQSARYVKTARYMPKEENSMIYIEVVSDEANNEHPIFSDVPRSQCKVISSARWGMYTMRK